MDQFMQNSFIDYFFIRTNVILTKESNIPVIDKNDTESLLLFAYAGLKIPEKMLNMSKHVVILRKRVITCDRIFGKRPGPDLPKIQN